jgi:DNA-binding transcriptional LysR family regulator
VLDLVKLKTFQVLAATHNFKLAAERLGYSQPSISTHIQALERELGAQLFDRSKRSVTLTEVGRRTLRYANRLLALADEAKADVHKHSDMCGPLSVGATEEALVTYRIPAILRQFQSLYPQVQLKLTSSPNPRAQLDDVSNNILDVAVIVDEAVRDDRFTSSFLGREEILTVRGSDYHFMTGTEFELENIADERVLLTESGSMFRVLFERALQAKGISLEHVTELGSIEAVKQCALAGMGLAVLPKTAVISELKKGQLISLPWPGAASPLYVQMVRKRDREISAALQAVWSIAEQSFARNLCEESMKN